MQGHVQGLLDLGLFGLQGHAFFLKNFLVQRPVQVGVQEAVLHVLEFGPSLGQGCFLTLLVLVDVGEGGLKRVANPIMHLLVRNPQRFQLAGDGGVQIFAPPADDRVIGPAMVIGTPVVEMLPYSPGPEFPADFLTGHRLAAVPASQHALGQGCIGSAGAAVLAVEDVLACLKDFLAHQRHVLSRIGLGVPDQIPDVEPIAQDVGQGRAVELWHARPIDVAFGCEFLGQGLEGLVALGVEVEDPHDRLGPLRMRLDRFVAVLRVHVAVGNSARQPSLEHLLVLALEHLGPEVVAVVLGDGGHDVEGE